jgi:Putative zinc-finger
VSCVEVRERLAEYALGVLPPQEARDVDRHLQWCPGCQKEAEELRDGTTAMAFSLPESRPPGGLEGRVVDSIQRAAGRKTQFARGRGIRALAVATLAALVLALGAMGWALAERRSAQNAQQDKARQIERIESFLKGQGSFQARLQPPASRPTAQDVGTTVIYSSPIFNDVIVVDANFFRQVKGAYRFQLLDRSGSVLSAGMLSQTERGDWLAWEATGRDLSMGIVVDVFNGAGRLVLSGPVRQNPGS